MTEPLKTKLLSRRRSLPMAVAAFLTLMAVAAVSPAWAQAAYPNKPLRIVVAFAPGGIVDLLARLVGEKLSERFGQPVVIENRAGAGGTLGAKIVAAAPADGYTLLAVSSAIVVNATASSNAVDPSSQLTPVALIAGSPTIFIAQRSVPARNLMEHVRGMKDGRFNYSTPGVGTVDHLTAEYLFKAVPGLNATHVPFAGGSQAINAVMGGHVDVTVTTSPAALSFIKSDGALRVLGVAAQQRSALLPDAPTLVEAGFPEIESASWVGLFAPADTPEAIVRSVNAEVNNALRRPEVRERLVTLGFDLNPMSSAEFAGYVKGEVAKWGKISKTIGFTLN